MVAEPGLDESTDPVRLIVADLPAIDTTVAHLRDLSRALERTAGGLRGIEIGQWTGDAADAFRARFDESPARWLAAADAFADAATACDAFRRTVARAREDAARAVELHRSGLEARSAAVADHDAAVAAFESQVAAGGPAPAPVPEFTDPGLPLLDRAARLLDDARRSRDEAGVEAGTIVAQAAVLAPEPPSVLGSMGAEFADQLSDGSRILTGFGEGVEGIARSVRALNPADLWNVTHPASYVDGLSSMAAGAVTSNLHPSEQVKGMVGTGWGSDPSGALGRVLPGIALSVATGGAGKVVGGAERGAAGRVVPHRPPETVPRAVDAAGAGSGGGTPERPPAKTEDSPDLPARAELRQEFRGENEGLSIGFGPTTFVRYFDDARRESARVTVHDGRLFDDRGQPFNSTTDGSWWSPGRDRSIFVMDGKGNLYVSNEQEPRVIHHSSLLSGAPVAGAGEIGVSDGRVTFLSDQSGHYTPPAECYDQVLAYLQKEGIDISAIDQERHGH